MSRVTLQLSQDRLLAMLKTSLGPVGGYLEDDEVIEIMCNPGGQIWVERLGAAPCATEFTLPAVLVEKVIRLVASHMGGACHETDPSLSAVLPESGARFQGFVYPVVTSPAFCIRKKALRVFTLDDYVRDGILTRPQTQGIREAVAQHLNIMVAGSTGSGKTTMLNAILAEIAQGGERIVTIEDTEELQCTAPNHLALYTKDGIRTMQQLVKDTMRCRPDRIILGELRDGTALDLLKAWSTGHPGGLCTIHANGAREILTRLEQLIQEAVVSVPRALIAEVVDVLIHLERTATGRRVRTMARVTGLDARGEYVVEPWGEDNAVGARPDAARGGPAA